MIRQAMSERAKLASEEQDRHMPTVAKLRFEIPGVDPRHLDNIFSDPRALLETREAELAAGPPTAFNLLFARVLASIRERTPDADYRRFQERWLRPDSLGGAMQFLKFLDLPFWLEARMRLIRRLGLLKGEPKRICDLGEGCGHFALVAEPLGHTVVGVDLPADDSPVARMYSEFRQLFGLGCEAHRIISDAPLPVGPERFDQVLALLTNFDSDPDGRKWMPRDWKCFLAGIKTSVLAEQGLVVLQLTNERVTDRSWEYLKSRASWFNEKSKELELDASAL